MYYITHTNQLAPKNEKSTDQTPSDDSLSLHVNYAAGLLVYTQKGLQCGPWGSESTCWAGRDGAATPLPPRMGLPASWSRATPHPCGNANGRHGFNRNRTKDGAPSTVPGQTDTLPAPKDKPTHLQTVSSVSAHPRSRWRSWKENGPGQYLRARGSPTQHHAGREPCQSLQKRGSGRGRGRGRTPRCFPWAC